MPRKAKLKTSEKASVPDSAGRFSYQGLDRVMHEKARLGIMASLAAHADGLLFNDLKQLCSLTDGNLSRHLGVLADADLVVPSKDGDGGRAQTLYRLTESGRSRFTEYISVLERVVADGQCETEKARLRSQDLAGVWSSS